jgi:hypothetical protein
MHCSSCLRSTSISSNKVIGEAGFCSDDGEIDTGRLQVCIYRETKKNKNKNTNTNTNNNNMTEKKKNKNK